MSMASTQPGVVRDFLQRLPNSAQHKVALLLPDPGPLEATCKSFARLMGPDGIMLEWFQARRPDLPATATFSDRRRHPGYALLMWPRLCCMSMAQLAVLLQRWLAQHHPQASHGDAVKVQRLLQAHNYLAAIQEMLPHSEHLLMLYAAQAGHLSLLRAMLAAAPPAAGQRVALQWDSHTRALCDSLLLPAAHAAVRGGSVEALQLLLNALGLTGTAADETAEQQAVLTSLVEAAARGGPQCESCASLLMAAWQRPEMGHRYHIQLAAASTGNGAVLQALLSRPPGPAARSETHDTKWVDLSLSWALRHGQLYLRQLLGHDAITTAKCICASLYDPSMKKSLKARDAPQLKLIPEGMFRIRAERDAEEYWGQALAGVVQNNQSLSVLPAIWAAFASAPAERRHMGRVMLREAARSPHALSDASLKWMVATVVPEVACSNSNSSSSSSSQAEDDWRACIAQSALGHGHTVLADALQPALARAGDDSWRTAALHGELLLAVRRGDIPGLHAAIAALGWQGSHQHAPANFNDFEDPREDAVKLALQAAAELKDSTVAEAAVHLLMPYLKTGYRVPDEVLLAHGGRLIAAACDGSDVTRGYCFNPPLLPGFEINGGLFRLACVKGHVGILDTIICHPEQEATCLSDWLVLLDDSSIPVGCHPQAATHSATELLHVLAGRRDAPHGHAESSGGAAAAAGARALPPAGGRRLRAPFLDDVLRSGKPDLLHALLVYIDRWGPLKAGLP